MAEGDAAAAVGMDVVPGIADLRESYIEHNKSRDYIARHQTSGTHPATAIVSGVLPIERGGTGGGTVEAARAALDIGSYVFAGGGAGMAGNVVRLGWSGSQLLAQVDATPLGPISFGGGSGGGGDATFANLYTPTGRATPATSNYVVAYLNSDGRVAGGASSRRYKQDIAEWSPDKQATLALQLYQFRYIAEVEDHGEDAAVEVGLMAEDLHELGLSWLVAYDEEGRPNSVHYERIALALLPVVQDHEARIAALEARLDGSAE